MDDRVQDPRERLLQAAVVMLSEEENLDAITVRKLAERAGVGVGLLNYHFRTKEALLNEAVSLIMNRLVGPLLRPMGDVPTDPVERLRLLIKGTSDIAVRYPKLTKVAASYELNQGLFQTPFSIVPLLKEVFGPGMTETELKLMAFQIVMPMQLLYIRADAFSNYCGIDVHDDAQRNMVIDLLIDNIMQVGSHK